MKAFLLWLGGAAVAFAALAGGMHMYYLAAPTRVLVVVDVSLPMQPALPRVPALLDEIDDARYTEFALRTDRSPIHGWRNRLEQTGLRAYGARDFDNLADLGEDADRRILITNADSAPAGWEILRP